MGMYITEDIGAFSDKDGITCRHQAQPCYCAESNCVGFIGGKTQTDIATLDDLYLDGMSCPQEFLMHAYSSHSTWHYRWGRHSWAEGYQEEEGKEDRWPWFRGMNDCAYLMISNVNDGSLPWSPLWKRTFQRSCKQYAKRKAAKSCPSCWHVSEYALPFFHGFLLWVIS